MNIKLNQSFRRQVTQLLKYLRLKLQNFENTWVFLIAEPHVMMAQVTGNLHCCSIWLTKLEKQ